MTSPLAASAHEALEPLDVRQNTTAAIAIRTAPMTAHFVWLVMKLPPITPIPWKKNTKPATAIAAAMIRTNDLIA